MFFFLHVFTHPSLVAALFWSEWFLSQSWEHRHKEGIHTVFLIVYSKKNFFNININITHCFSTFKIFNLQYILWQHVFSSLLPSITLYILGCNFILSALDCITWSYGRRCSLCLFHFVPLNSAWWCFLQDLPKPLCVVSQEYWSAWTHLPKHQLISIQDTSCCSGLINGAYAPLFLSLHL